MKKKDVWQEHHITYEPELTVMVTRAEHHYITRLSWFKSLTAGCKQAIRAILKDKPTKRK